MLIFEDDEKNISLTFSETSSIYHGKMPATDIWMMFHPPP